MKRAIAIILFTCAMAAGDPRLPVAADDPVTVIEGGTLIDGTGGQPLENAVVVVRGNRIATVGTRGKVSYPRQARVIRADGKFILPRLIDAHVHYHEWQGELHLAHGVTTVKDTGNPVEWLEALSRAIAAGQTAGPRLFYTGNSLTSPPALKDHHVGLQSPEMGRRAVRILKARGAIAAKVHQQITPELLRAIADEAHRLGLPVTGHLRRIGAQEAAQAGIDGLEHSTGIPRSTGANPGRLVTDDPENDLVGYYDDLNEAAEMKEENFAPLVRLLVEKKVAIVPTLVTWFRVASDRRAAYAREDAVFAQMGALRYVPEDVRKLWQTSAIYEPAGAGDLERFRRAYAKMSRFLRQFHDAGGTLIAGSATSVMVPGLSMHREMEMMVDLGLSPRQVIVMAARQNSEFLRQDKELGTVTVGKLADLLVVERNPLEDIKNIGRVALVLKDGKLVDRGYHADYRMPVPRPRLTRPIWLEQQLK